MKLLQIQRLALSDGGATVSITLKAGECLGIVGPAASGKSLLLSCLLGDAKPKRGSAKLESDSIAAGPIEKKRITPALLAKGELGSSAAAEALSACHLWDARSKPCASLTPSQMAATELLPLLVSKSRVLAIDGQLERLDPWTLEAVWSLLESRMSCGDVVLVATNRLELVEKFGYVVALNGGQVRYAGPVRDLPGSESETLVVETESQLAVRAIAGPFEVAVAENADGLRMQPGKGQEAAARLLAEGYGDVRAVVTRRVGEAERVRRLIG